MKRRTAITVLTAVMTQALGWGGSISMANPGSSTAADETMTQADYRDIPLITITGDTTSLREFTGDVLLVVNVASKCGNTPQYEGLERLEKSYFGRGFHVIGFPANNFGGQEPGTNEEVLAFCRETYGVTFPMMSKISVKGDDIHPLYEYLTEQSPYPGDIPWNFSKFLLDREGKVLARFGPKESPEGEILTTAIEEALR